MAKEKVKCPDCDGMFFPPGLGPHRARMHGAKKPEPKAAVLRGSQIAHLRGSFPCTEEGCKFVAQWKGGLTNHMRRHEKKRSKSIERSAKAEIAVNGHQEAQVQAAGDAQTHPDYITAIAFGRFTEFCRGIALEWGLSQVDVTNRIVGAVLQSQVRDSPRNSNRLSALRR